MSKRKGLSVEEKRSRLLELFYEKKDVYNYKEVEKVSLSEKGITVQSVKDILVSLIADGYVDTDKIGTSVYYWAFPSKALSTRNKRLTDLRVKAQQAELNIQSAKETQAEQARLREDTAERRELLSEFEVLRKDKLNLTKELELYKDSDPDVIALEKTEIEEAVSGVNRWTDNLDNLRSWVKNKFSMSDADFSAQTGIPEDWEYLDVKPTQPRP